MKKWLSFALFTLLATVCIANQCDMPPVPVPEPTQKAVNFYKSGNFLWIVQNVWGLVIPALILFSGFAAWLRKLCDRVTQNWLLHTALFALIYLIITAVLTFPIDYYASYIRPHVYGLSTQTIDRWLNYYFLNTAISTVMGLIVVWILYAIIRKSPRRWWLYFGIITFPLIVFLVIIQPIWIAPLFNKFGPMKDTQLEQKILHLASRAGIQGSRVYEVDKSADTKQINAYVTGVGASKRIVIWDTAIKELTEDQLLFVMGHEMGHYVLHHIWWSLIFYTFFSIITLYLIYLCSKWCLKKWEKRLGFSQVANIASLPLIIFFYSFFSLILAPAENLFTQSLEHNADTFGLELTELNHSAATGFVKLQSSNLGYPWPGKLFMLFRASHPSIGERITYFNTYAPYCHGEPLKYGKFFTKPENSSN
ncbi:MAG: M48 family metallopeptidase [Chlamydiia bacterium]|nr:M48 family metallopeptidase [Chlamydiia bacterium]